VANAASTLGVPTQYSTVQAAVNAASPGDTMRIRPGTYSEQVSIGLRRVRPRRDFGALEDRRMRAADMFERRVKPAEIARQVGVSHQIVSDWRAAWRRSGRDGLRAAGRAGRLPKLNETNSPRSKSTWPKVPKPTAAPTICAP
jgi:transposase-like protein